MMEEWRAVPGYEGLYEVSNIGNVRNVRKNTLLRLTKTNNGYIRVGLCKNGIKTGLRVHRLVAQAFIPNPNNLPQVNHKNEDKSDNSVDNLEWCDQAYNNLYGTRLEKSINTKIKNGYVNEENVGLSREEYMKKYYQEHKKELCEKSKEWRENNREKYNERNRERTKEWRENNREKYNEWQREYRLKKKNKQNIF